VEDEPRPAVELVLDGEQVLRGVGHASRLGDLPEMPVSHDPRAAAVAGVLVMTEAATGTKPGGANPARRTALINGRHYECDSARYRAGFRQHPHAARCWCERL